MASFNKVILMGNLTRDPELRQTQSGNSVCRFSIAMNRSYTANDGSSRDETCFVEVDAFGRSAENVAKYFTKGKPILIEGRLRQEENAKDVGSPTYEEAPLHQQRGFFCVTGGGSGPQGEGRKGAGP